VLLSDGFFESRYQRDPNAIGRSLTIDKTSYTIAGVLPPSFHLPSTHEGTDQLKPEVWVPLSRLPHTDAEERNRELRVIARMKLGVTLAQARTEMEAVMERVKKSDPDFANGWTTSVFELRTEDTNPEIHQALYVLMGAVAFLLLIACANLA